MLIEVQVKYQNLLDYALKTLKKKMQREGVYREMKNSKYHQSKAAKRLLKRTELSRKHSQARVDQRRWSA